MPDTPRERLGRIADLLEPDLWLEVGRGHVETYFGYDLYGSERELAVQAAKLFAQRNGCTCSLTPDGYGLRFGKVYPRQRKTN
jgi:hypothetical protein